MTTEQATANATAETAREKPVLPGDQALPLMQALTTWGNTTTIILHGGCVFEFKGPFPQGEMGEGFYNLDGPVPGFHGHINLKAIDHIAFQEKPHRGRASYAFVFNDSDGKVIFKVFLGRDANGELLADQLEAFQRIKAQGHV